jgi:hypothetical protein
VGHDARSRTRPTSNVGGTSRSGHLDPLFLTSVTTAAAGAALVLVLRPEPFLSAALMVMSVAIVTVHAWKLRARWRTSTTLSSHGMTAFITELAAEVERARRYGRTVSAALVSMPADQGRGLVYLATRVRSVDRVFTDPNGQVLVLLPETDGAQADRFLARAVHPELDVQAVRATFPTEAHTADGLVSVLHQKLDTPGRSHVSEA